MVFRPQITWDDLKAAEHAVGEFGGDNRAGVQVSAEFATLSILGSMPCRLLSFHAVQGTLHRISALRNRKGTVVGLTCRVGRAVTGHIDMIRDMIEGACSSQSVTDPDCADQQNRLFTCDTLPEKSQTTALAAKCPIPSSFWAVRVWARRL